MSALVRVGYGVGAPVGGRCAVDALIGGHGRVIAPGDPAFTSLLHDAGETPEGVDGETAKREVSEELPRSQTARTTQASTTQLFSLSINPCDLDNKQSDCLLL